MKRKVTGNNRCHTPGKPATVIDHIAANLGLLLTALIAITQVAIFAPTVG